VLSSASKSVEKQGSRNQHWLKFSTIPRHVGIYKTGLTPLATVETGRMGTKIVLTIKVALQ